MNVRKIRDNELKRTKELFGIAFEFQIDNSLTAEEEACKARTNPTSRQDVYLNDKWAAFDDDDNMMAFISTTHYDVRFDGHEVRMTGIGGVSTLPQYRRNGAVRECFNRSLKDAYLNDVTLSYLYPFSTAYYRKFGYELCTEQMRYSVNLKSIKRFEEADGQVYLIEHGAYLDDYKRIYDSFAARYNMMCVRSDIDYKFIENANPAKDGNYIYIYKSKSGEPKGAMSFKKVKWQNDNRFDIVCSSFFFTDMEGFKGLLNHSLAFTSYYENCVFSLPMNINITSYIPEWALHSYKRECLFNGMVRVVNVKQVLSLARYKGSGELNISVADNQIEQNNNTFRVQFKDGRAAEVSVTDMKCDIELSINDFSRLIVGTHDSEEIQLIENVKIYSNKDSIERVFYKKPSFIADYF